MRRVLIGVFVALFAIVDLLLVVAMYLHVNKTPAAVTLPAAKASATLTAGDPAATDGAPQQQSYEFKPVAAVSMSVANDGSYIWAQRGQCDGTTRAVVTVQVPGDRDPRVAETGLAEVTAVRARSQRELVAVGAGTDCQVTQVESDNGGRTWTPSPTVTIWYQDVVDAQRVVSLSGSSKPGCVVTSLSQFTDQAARVTCEDGTVLGTGNGGQKWQQLGRLDNVRVAVFPAPGNGYALAAYQGCAAQEFTTRDGGRTWVQGGCIAGQPAQAIAYSPNRLGAVVAGTIYQSTNDGDTWSTYEVPEPEPSANPSGVGPTPSNGVTPTAPAAVEPTP